MKRFFMLVGGALLAAPIAAWALQAQQAPFDNDGVITKAEWQRVMALGAKGGVIDLGQQRVEFQRGKLQPTKPLILRGGVFSAISLDQWRNVTFEGTIFRPAATDNRDYWMVVAYDPQNLTFDRVNMSGATLGDGKLVYQSLSVRNGSNVAVLNSRFWGMANFMGFMRTNGVRLENNHFTNIREGVQLVAVNNAVVRGNAFGPYFPYQGDHSDGVQLFTAGLTASDVAARNVTIEGNLFVANPSRRAQGVFIRDEGGLFKSGRGYADITIRNNLMVGTGWAGIGVIDPVQRLLIDNNHLLIRTDKSDRVTNNWIEVRAVQPSGSARVTNNKSGPMLLAAGVQHANNQVVPPVTEAEGKRIIDQWYAARQRAAPPARQAASPTTSSSGSESATASSPVSQTVRVRRGNSVFSD